jgi:hypothetical protein
MPLTNADIAVQLLMDSTVNLQETESRITTSGLLRGEQPRARACGGSGAGAAAGSIGCHQSGRGDLRNC